MKGRIMERETLGKLIKALMITINLAIGISVIIGLSAEPFFQVPLNKVCQYLTAYGLISLIPLTGAFIGIHDMIFDC